MHQPQILTCDVMHLRTAPVRNGFTYKVYYLWWPLRQIEALSTRLLSVDRFNLFSFYHRDHGYRDARSSTQWLSDQLSRFDLPQLQPDVFEGEWMLCAMPRVLGYVFNPVSFWCAITHEGELAAVVAEVNNTFGETHAYLLHHADGQPIDPQEWIEADKQFHVSPFLEVKGRYRFRFHLRDAQKIGIWIDYFDEPEHKMLLTAMTGRLQPYKNVTLWKAFCHIPFVTFKVIGLIHYQALKLWLKKVRYRCKPPHPGHLISKWPKQ